MNIALALRLQFTTYQSPPDKSFPGDEIAYMCKLHLQLQLLAGKQL